MNAKSYTCMTCTNYTFDSLNRFQIYERFWLQQKIATLLFLVVLCKTVIYLHVEGCCYRRVSWLACLQTANAITWLKPRGYNQLTESKSDTLTRVKALLMLADSKSSLNVSHPILWAMIWWSVSLKHAVLSVVHVHTDSMCTCSNCTYKKTGKFTCYSWLQCCRYTLNRDPTVNHTY